MSSNSNYLDITLLGKEYRVACPAEEKDALRRAAAYVDEKIRGIAEKKRANGERVAVMVALNVAHEFLCLQDQRSEENQTPAPHDATGVDFDDTKRRIASMEAQLDAVLELQDKLI
ncbi:MAG: cell division protein ZapA [Candidatus Accumulibacter sp.]|jgi:cell division protein ZapA|nr:cell division protein ZapA [Accumulibacter sp.]